MAPFWSPESDEIGFFTEDALKRISVADRNLKTITRLDYHVIRMATWGAGGTIVFQTDSGHGLLGVSVQNESVVAVTTLMDGDTEHYWPVFLEDGRHFLFVRYRGEASTLAIGVVGEEGTRALTTDGLEEGTLGYMPGYVLYELDGGLFARPFDEDALDFSGSPDRVLDQIPR